MWFGGWNKGYDNNSAYKMLPMLTAADFLSCQTDAVPELALGAGLQDSSALFLQTRLLPRAQWLSPHAAAFSSLSLKEQGEVSAHLDQISSSTDHSTHLDPETACTTNLGITKRTLLPPASFPIRARLVYPGVQKPLRRCVHWERK